jgi:hypothetical protein
VVTTPAALILSIIGIIRGSSRPAAIAGTVISGLMVVIFFGVPVLMHLIR